MEQFEELDIKRLFKIITQSVSFILAMTLLVGIVAFVYSETMILPSYRSEVTMYVNNNNRSTLLSKTQISSADMQASQRLVETYIEILKSDTVMSEVAVEAERRYGIKYSSKEILSMFSANSVNETEILKVNITGNNPEHTALIANIVADVAPHKLSEYIETGTVKIIDTAEPGIRVAPNIQRNTMLGFILGFLFSCGVIVIREIFDTRVKSETDLENWFHKSILGIIPEIGNPDNASSKYYYYRRSYKYGRGYGRTKYMMGGYSYGKQQYAEFIKAAQNATNRATTEEQIKG